jgi:hypothetical protein
MNTPASPPNAETDKPFQYSTFSRDWVEEEALDELDLHVVDFVTLDSVVERLGHAANLGSDGFNGGPQ